MTAGLAAAAAVCYGLTHFFAGLVSRSAPGMTVSLFAQVGGTLMSVLVVLAVPGGTPTASALLWGVVSGAGAGFGVAFLYRGLGRGQMSVVAPLSEVCAAAIPVAAGVLVFGQVLSPVASAGVLVAFLAIWLISRSAGKSRRPTAPGAASAPRKRRTGVLDGLLGGTGVAVNYIGLAPIPAEAGLWPFVVTRAVSVLAILPLVSYSALPVRLPRSRALSAAFTGVLGTIAALLYLLATHQGNFAIAAVLASLYPVVTVVLAVLLLGERLSRTQTFGLVLGIVALICCSSVDVGGSE